VAAAAELIFERGVAETTLEDIRAAAGVSSSQMYHYFADKEALVRAVIDYRAQTVVGEVTSRCWPRSRVSTASGHGGT
jgi:Transcriptional regulator